MIDENIALDLAYAMFALAAMTCVALRFVVAPYGRHARAGWGPAISERVGWMIMESPSLILFSAIYWAGSKSHEPVRIALWAMWATHYTHRMLVYPQRLRGSGKRMPLAIVAMGFSFNVLNATLNANLIGHLGHYDASWFFDPRFVIGACLFWLGFAVNLSADRRLLALRARSKGYAVPHGGLHELVASPNYFGEIIEWSGWALASFSIGGAAFAVYTIANLAPRAASHHAWYRKTFPEYPAHRKALVPFVW